MSPRCFHHNLSEKQPPSEEQFRHQAASILYECLLILKKHSELENPSVYIGHSGYALTLYRIARVLKSDQNSFQVLRREYSVEKLLKEALEALQWSLKRFSSTRQATFLEGRAGTLAVAAAVYHHLNDMENAELIKQQLVNLYSHVKSMPEDQCELLYGRAGYLSAIHFVRHECNAPGFAQYEAQKILKQIIVYGLSRAKKDSRWKLSLLYPWHECLYLGAAHGLIGILHIFVLFQNDLQTLLPVLEKFGFSTPHEILTTVLTQLLQVYMLPSGDVLVKCEHLYTPRPSLLTHWCHGSPGFILLLCAFLHRFNLSKTSLSGYKKDLTTMAETVWTKGLLKKGLGLCHGIGGNALVLLCVSQVMDQQLWLARGRQFLLFGWEHLETLYSVPDHPNSLFEGLAGYVWALCDAIQPTLAGFPGLT